METYCYYKNPVWQPFMKSYMGKISGAPVFGRRRECREFVSISLSFLGRFQNFKDLIGEHVKPILMNPVTSLNPPLKKSVAPQTLAEDMLRNAGHPGVCPCINGIEKTSLFSILREARLTSVGAIPRK